MRLLRGEYARLDLQEALSLWWGRWGRRKVCMVAVQIEGGAERAGWLWVDQDSRSFTAPTSPFISDVFKSADIY